MFFSLRKKHVHLLFVVAMLLIVTFTMVASSHFVSEETNRIIKSKLRLNYFDTLASNFYLAKSTSKENPDEEDVDTSDPESYFNKKVEKLYTKKVNSDIENKYWLLNTDVLDTELTIPYYFYMDETDAGADQSVAFHQYHKDNKPAIQPFDPRFTLAMYYHHIRTSIEKNPKEKVEIPFNWYDWVDLSILNKYILAPTALKPNCSILDARPDEEKINKQKKFEEEQKKKIEEAKKKIEEDKKKAEEAIKKAEEDKKNEEERKKKEEEERKNEEERKKKEEEEKKKQEEEDKKKQEEKKKLEDSSKEENGQNNDQSDQEKPKEESNPEQDKQEKRDESSTEERHTFSKRLDANDPADFCVDNHVVPFDHDDGHDIRPGFNVFKTTGKTTPEKAILSGKSYLYSYAPAPSMIIFLTSDGSYNVTVNSNKKLLNNGLVEKYIGDSQSHSIDVLAEFTALKKAAKPNKHQVMNAYKVDIPEERFELKYESMIQDYESRLLGGHHLPTNELKYYQSLKYSDYKVKNGGPPKYFGEARLLTNLLGDHYDWRFFNGVMYGTYEQTLILHRLVRTWLSFTRKNGIITWVAHGSLLSWYWNGIAFPWDNDIDVQVPIMDLHKLSLEFNQTLVVEDPEDGFGRYFLDCGSFITLREKGNGNNNIDARFIDVDSGLYIDITGLAISNTEPPKRYRDLLPKDYKIDNDDYVPTNKFLKTYNCRNKHFSRLSELSPLIKTSIEGEIGYVPQKYTDILNVEYSKGLLSKKFSRHIFLPQLRLWLREEDLYYFIYHRENWNKYHSYNSEYISRLNSGNDTEEFFTDFKYELTDAEKKMLKQKAQHKPLELKDDEMSTIFKFTEDELLELLNKDEIFMNFYGTREFTGFHEEEIMRLLFGKSSAQLINDSPDFRPMKYDPFLFKMHNEYITFEEEVNRYLALLSAYEQQESELVDKFSKDKIAAEKALTPKPNPLTPVGNPLIPKMPDNNDL
ncbi:LicD family-domain-containing protein [Scheffersomyces xylosifermentans]|uniref:LicD family-domain-containing protein n=1 Tax=Scheffersomyces xylosifermentans TaxID=1304137 RepID=UPI00315D6644